MPLSLFLGQTTPPAGFASFIENVAWTAITIAAVVFAWRQVTGKSGEPQPFEVKAHEAPVTRDQLDKVDNAIHGRLKRERSEIDAQIARVESIAERRSEKIEDKIDENTKLTERMGGQLTQINQSVTQLTTSVTNFLRDSANRSKQ